MRPHLYAVTVVILLCTIKATEGWRKYGSGLYDRSEKHIHRDPSISDLHREFENLALDKEEEQNMCHKTALHKCGQSFLKTFKLFSYITNDVAFKTRCAIRTAFFNCYKTIREKICRKHGKFPIHKHEAEFQRKLTEALWSTRVCVLGINSYSTK